MGASNIVVGAPATVLVAAQGVAEGSAVDLGVTEGGAKIIWDADFYEKEADQYVASVGAVKIKEKCRVEVTLAECTLANLAYAFGYPTTAVSSQTLSIGGSAVATERTLYINSNAIAGGLAKWTFFKVVLTGATEVHMDKKGKTVLKCTFLVLQDTSKTANQQMFTCVYSATDTTPPTVAMTAPAEDGTVLLNAKGTVTLTFTEAGNAIDEGSLIYGDSANASVRVLNVTDATAIALVAGTIAYNATTKVLTFTPTANWTASDKHVIVIDTKVRDTAGNNLAATFFGHFTVTAA
jgi:hypothetical protein